MRRRALASLLLLGCGGQASAPARPTVAVTAPSKPTVVPFEYVAGHFLVVRVRVADSIDTRFVLDTGIGVNLISDKLCEQLACQRRGSHTGKRMSGQDVSIPLATLGSIALGDHRATDVQVGTFDFEARGFGIDPSIWRSQEDETGYAYTRFFAKEPIAVRALTAPPAVSVPVKTMFQKIIYDGLLGDAYLKHFVVTFDLARARIVFAPLPS